MINAEICVHCNKDTSLGSGKFVNRIPSDDNWLCYECDQEIEQEIEFER